MLTQANNAITTTTVSPSAFIADVKLYWTADGDIDLWVWEPNGDSVSLSRRDGYGHYYGDVRRNGPERYTLNCSNLVAGRY
jgi:hypothetical protein